MCTYEELINYINTLSKVPLKDDIDLKVGDIVQWVNVNGVIWQNMIVGFSDGGDLGKYGKCVHLDTDSYWVPHHPNELTVVKHLDEPKQKAYLNFKKYEVYAESVEDFLKEYTKHDRHGGRGEEYVKIRTESYKRELSENGYCFISKHDSKTGEIVSFYSHFVGIKDKTCTAL